MKHFVKDIQGLKDAFNEFKGVDLEKGYFVTLKRRSVAKTMSQNRYIWLVFTYIGQEIGYHSKEVYGIYLAKFPTYKTVYINGEERYSQITMSQFSKEQMTVFIDNVIIDASEYVPNIPDPNSLEALNMYNHYREKGLI